ncbi:MAG: hypothetical protein KAT35_01730, partial [Candidatus Aenigmarchaeota archaeon]|nr:hypothetical protein [Candidatus Aenigmarchaeota archaeon]
FLKAVCPAYEEFPYLKDVLGLVVQFCYDFLWGLELLYPVQYVVILCLECIYPVFKLLVILVKSRYLIFCCVHFTLER